MWSSTDPLPRLWAQPLRVRPSKPELRGEQGASIRYYDRNAVATGTRRTKALAMERVTSLLTEAFGELPATMGFVILEDSDLDSDHPEADVAIHQSYRGIPTDHLLLAYFAGASVRLLEGRVAAFTEVEGTAKPCISRAEALAAWRVAFKMGGASAEDPSRLDNDFNPTLLFYFSSQHSSVGTEVLAPMWQLDANLPWLVDGHSGKVVFDQ